MSSLSSAKKEAEIHYRQRLKIALRHDALRKTLEAIIAEETPYANATVRRIVKIARHAIASDNVAESRL